MKPAVAGASAAIAWAAVEPLFRAIFRTPYSDLRLLGTLVTRGRLWPLPAVAMHAVNGAAFGVAADAVGVRGWKRGLLAAEAEGVGLWPAMALVDRYHPERRAGRWPRLVTNGRALGMSACGHAVFGVVLGVLLERRARSGD